MRVMPQQKQMSLGDPGTVMQLTCCLGLWGSHFDNKLNLPCFTANTPLLLSISCCLEQPDTAGVGSGQPTPRPRSSQGLQPCSKGPPREEGTSSRQVPPVSVPGRTGTGEQPGSGFSRLFQNKPTSKFLGKWLQLGAGGMGGSQLPPRSSGR